MNVHTHMIDGPIIARPGDGLRATHARMREHDIHHMPVLDDKDKVVGVISEHDILVPRHVDLAHSGAGGFVIADSVTVADAMSAHPVVLHPGDTLKTAVGLFLMHRFSALPVVDGSERLVGMLTTKDMLLVLQDHLG